MGTQAEAAKQIIALAKTGFAFQASVGVSPTETQRIDSIQKTQCNGRIIKAPKSGCLLVTDVGRFRYKPRG